jgi:hypothetical protein
MIINLISGPRNISTALMTSFAQRQDTKVLDEPFYAYYLEKTGIDHPGREETLASLSADLKDVLKRIEKCQEKSEHVFVKNMAHHLIDMDFSLLLKYKNVFLIRDPKALIASYSKVIPKPSLDDIGIEQSTKLFEFLRSRTGETPSVLNSNEILKNPSKTLRNLCARLGISFDEKMLSWEKGKVYDPVPWSKYWYTNTLNSTGFGKPKNDDVKLTEYGHKLYLDALPFYETLNQYSIRA